MRADSSTIVALWFVRAVAAVRYEHAALIRWWVQQQGPHPRSSTQIQPMPIAPLQTHRPVDPSSYEPHQSINQAPHSVSPAILASLLMPVCPAPFFRSSSGNRIRSEGARLHPFPLSHFFSLSSSARAQGGFEFFEGSLLRRSQVQAHECFVSSVSGSASLLKSWMNLR